MHKLISAAVFTAFSALTITAAVTTAQTSTSTSTSSDSRIQTTLDQLGIKYQILDNGNFQINANLEDGRSQRIFINSETQKLGDMEIRMLHSAAYYSKESVPQSVANQLLNDNSSLKIGGWQTVEFEDKSVLGLFSTKVKADLTPDELRGLISMTLYKADEMEQKLNSEDKF